jgi:hypothetical protein
MIEDSRKNPPSRDSSPEGFALQQGPGEEVSSNGRESWPQSAVLAEAAVREAFAEREEQRQFTLRDLFLLVTFCAMLSVPLSRLPREMFAGLIGGMTVLLMFVESFCERRHAFLRYGWWALLATYLSACAMAVAGL